MKTALVMLAGFVTMAPGALAQIDSVRLGVMEHNICVSDCKNADKEAGANITGEVRFSSPDSLLWAGAPHPYLIVSLNTAGNTSYAGGGLQWDWALAPGWRLEPGFGYVLHDGDINNPFRSGTQAAVDYSARHVLLGSRDLFRTSLALTWDVSADFALQAIYEHLSHGQILGSGRNQGLDEVGLRAVWRLS